MHLKNIYYDLIYGKIITVLKEKLYSCQYNSGFHLVRNSLPLIPLFIIGGLWVKSRYQKWK